MPVAVERELFELREAVGVDPDTYDPKRKTVEISVLRPCVGRGKGRHVYEASMLRENAHKFAGWKMYVNHESEADKRRRGGLPRNVEELGGRVLESWWDDAVPAEGDYEQGAVVARVRPTRKVRELVEDDPQLVEASINARATSVRPVTRGGREAWLVEGIEDRGTVDWVTEGGAGGGVRGLSESVYHDEQEKELAVFDSLTDEELVQKLREQRPELVEALAENRSASAAQPAAPAAVEAPPPAPAAPESSAPPAPEFGEQDVLEALRSEEATETISDLIESRLERERAIIRAEALAQAERLVQLREMRTEAHRIIEGARLAPIATANLKREFDLSETGPSQSLDVIDEINDEGEVVKTASDKLREAVDDAVRRTREMLAEAAPTSHVRGQGAASVRPDGEGGGSGSEGEDAPPQDRPYWQRTLQEAGVEKPEDIEFVSP